MAHADRVTETARRIEQAILSGKLSTGEQLPSEREISAEMGVSRSVVREALGRLASLGLVRSVTAPAPASRRRAASRSPPAIRSCCGGEKSVSPRWPPCVCRWKRPSPPRPPGGAPTTTSTAWKPPRPRWPTRASLEADVKADLEFHALLAEATGNPLFGIVLTPIQELLIESRRAHRGPAWRGPGP